MHLPLTHLIDSLTATIFPVACLLCQRTVSEWKNGAVCQQCWAATVHWPGTAGCQKCGYPTGQGVTAYEQCFRCRQWPITAARACGPYQHAWQAMVHYLKTNPYLCPQLRHYWQHCYQQHPILHANNLIIPVPLHPDRLTERGFNQAEILAQALQPVAKLPLDTQSLIRQKATIKHRRGLNRQLRQANVTQAFVVTRPRIVANANILLVDDVFTTGSTIIACAETLLAAGARQVQVMTLARVA
jgi:ComF family protein